jgi:hypothetical protein
MSYLVDRNIESLTSEYPVNNTPSKHRHEWAITAESKTETRTIKVSECKGCDVAKIETIQLIDANLLAEELHVRDTQRIPPGEYEDDRLVLKAYATKAKKDSSGSWFSVSLQDVAAEFCNLLPKAGKPVPKDGAVQLVSDRMEKLGFGSIKPAFYDTSYKVVFDQPSFSPPAERLRESMKFVEKRLWLRGLLDRMQLELTPLAEFLDKTYDAAGWHTNTLFAAITMAVREEIKRKRDPLIECSIIKAKVAADLGIDAKECDRVLDAATRDGDILLEQRRAVSTDNSFPAHDVLYFTTPDAEKVLDGEIDIDGHPTAGRLRSKH